MNLRHDALAGASEWIGVVEQGARSTPGLVATVGRLDVSPGAGNVIAGSAHASLDVRHANDNVRRELFVNLLTVPAKSLRAADSRFNGNRASTRPP